MKERNTWFVHNCKHATVSSCYLRSNCHVGFDATIQSQNDDFSLSRVQYPLRMLVLVSQTESFSAASTPVDAQWLSDRKFSLKSAQFKVYSRVALRLSDFFPHQTT